MNSFAQFKEIRAMYAHVLPKWKAQYKETGRMMFDPYLLDWEFSPIERDVWCDIRGAGLPFYPQVPVLNYFIDFGNPFLRIGIECDGKEWHDKEKDAARDARLSAEGWTIYRIPGHECRRSFSMTDEDDRTEEDQRYRRMRYYLDTSEGIIEAIGAQHFGKEPKAGYERAYGETLIKHQAASGVV